jgi:ribosome-binding factor A
MRREDEEGAGHRHLRVQSLVLEELRALLRYDVSDPALADVRVVAALFSVDYRHAKVHFILSGRSATSRRSAEHALQRATPSLRARLADAIDMKRVPDLRFVFDGITFPGSDDDGGDSCSG